MLKNQDFDKFHALDSAMLARVEQMLAKDIADIMTLVPQEAALGTDISGKTLFIHLRGLKPDLHCWKPVITNFTYSTLLPISTVCLASFLRENELFMLLTW